MRHLPQLGLAITCLVLLGQAAPRPPATGVVQGRVETFFGGKPEKVEELYVYVEAVAAKPSAILEVTKKIEQRGKQFKPRVIVVPVGTTVVFPNEDNEDHNVFSPAFGKWVGFENGRYRPKEPGPTRKFLELGEFDIYCDLHPQMSAKVKVVPTRQFVQAIDGKYKLAGVPPGTYRVVAWAPNSREVRSETFTLAAGAVHDVETLNLQYKKPPTTHLRKDGSAYGPGDYQDR